MVEAELILRFQIHPLTVEAGNTIHIAEHGLTADEALAAFLRVKPDDLKKAEAKEKLRKSAKRKTNPR